MFDLTAYNTFNLTVFCKEARTISTIDDLVRPVSAPFIVIGSGSDVLFTEDFDGTVLINRIYGITVETVFKSGRTQKVVLKPESSDKQDEPLEQSTLASSSQDTQAEACPQTQAAHQPQDQAPDEAQDEADAIEYYKVRIGGGEILDETIELLLEQGISGLENLSLIPGTVGAAPIQNIGAYGVEIGDVIESVEAFDFAQGCKVVLSKEECQFGYRTSYFKQHKERSLFITHVNLKLRSGFTPIQNYAGLQSFEFKDALSVRNRVIALRNLKLPNPRYVGNAGSFFKNPYVSAQVLDKLRLQYDNVPAYAQADGSFKLAAGWLIDKAGCRGIRHGHAGTWGNQALVIVNLGKAKPHEIVAMAKYVSAEVKSKFGLDLIPEVRLYGRHGEKEWDQI